MQVPGTGVLLVKPGSLAETALWSHRRHRDRALIVDSSDSTMSSVGNIVLSSVLPVVQVMLICGAGAAASWKVCNT